MTGIKDVMKSGNIDIYLPTVKFFLLVLTQMKLREGGNKAKQDPHSTLHATELSKQPDVEREHFLSFPADKSVSQKEIGWRYCHCAFGFAHSDALQVPGSCRLECLIWLKTSFPCFGPNPWEAPNEITPLPFHSAVTMCQIHVLPCWASSPVKQDILDPLFRWGDWGFDRLNNGQVSQLRAELSPSSLGSSLHHTLDTPPMAHE